MMCACEPGYLCPRCAGTPADPGYLYEPDPEPTREPEPWGETEKALGLMAP